MRMVTGTTWPVEDAKRYILDRVQEVPWSGCWLWEGPINVYKYGRFHVPRGGGLKMLAHRVSFEAFVEPPGDLVVMHTCDVPACCNPDHLRSGTARENVDDRVKKSRCRWTLPAQHHARAVEMYASGMYASDVAKEFGVSTNTVLALLRKKDVPIRASRRATAPQHDACHELRARGESVAKISRAIGLPASTVYRELRRERPC